MAAGHLRSRDILLCRMLLVMPFETTFDILLMFRLFVLLLLLLIFVSDSLGAGLTYAAGGGNKSRVGGDFSFADESSILDANAGGDGGAKGNGSLKSKSGGGFKNAEGIFSSTEFEQLDEQSISLSGVASPLEFMEFFLLYKKEYLFRREKLLC